MTRYARALGFVALLTLGLVLATGQNSARAYEDDKETIKAAQKDLVDLAKAIDDGKDGKEQAAAIRKKYEDLAPIMHIYKPSTKGGIGIGTKGAGDGMELKIINLGKRAPAAKDKDDIVKIGQLNIAIGEVTKLYAPAKPKGGKGAKDWTQHCEDQIKASKDLIAAAKSGAAAKVKAAANNLNNACNNCHSDFRD
ncbi:MAG: cytochrome c [Gemmataceae bacterium]